MGKLTGTTSKFKVVFSLVSQIPHFVANAEDYETIFPYESDINILVDNPENLGSLSIATHPFKASNDGINILLDIFATSMDEAKDHVIQQLQFSAKIIEKLHSKCQQFHIWFSSDSKFHPEMSEFVEKELGIPSSKDGHFQIQKEVQPLYFVYEKSLA